MTVVLTWWVWSHDGRAHVVGVVTCSSVSRVVSCTVQCCQHGKLDAHEEIAYEGSVRVSPMARYRIAASKALAEMQGMKIDTISWCRRTMRRSPESRGCAVHRSEGVQPTGRGANIYLLFIFKDTSSTIIAQYLEYYLMLGVQRVIAFDNSCVNNSNSAHTLTAKERLRKIQLQQLRDADLSQRGRILRSYIDAGLLTLDTRLQCVNLHHYRRDEFPQRDQRGASGIVKWIVRADPALDPPEGSLVVALDVDEMLFSDVPLEQLRVEMVKGGICAHHVDWLTFGTSGHRCEPEGGNIKNFYRRSPVGAEASALTASLANAEAQRLHLNALYPSGRDARGGFGKMIVIWSRNLTCGTHTCQGKGMCRLSPSNRMRRAGLVIAHYYTGSDEEWSAKKKRGRTSNGAVNKVRSYCQYSCMCT